MLLHYAPSDSAEPDAHRVAARTRFSRTGRRTNEHALDDALWRKRQSRHGFSRGGWAAQNLSFSGRGPLRPFGHGAGNLLSGSPDLPGELLLYLLGRQGHGISRGERSRGGGRSRATRTVQHVNSSPGSPGPIARPHFKTWHSHGGRARPGLGTKRLTHQVSTGRLV